MNFRRARHEPPGDRSLVVSDARLLLNQDITDGVCRQISEMCTACAFVKLQGIDAKSNLSIVSVSGALQLVSQIDRIKKKLFSGKVMNIFLTSIFQIFQNQSDFQILIFDFDFQISILRF